MSDPAAGRRDAGGSESGVAGIVLAAGTSSRFGDEVKQLHALGGEPLVRHVPRAALASRLDPVVVVVGHAERRVRAALAGLDVRIVPNPRYRDGQASSVRAGLAALGPETRAALFLPADQPLLTSALLDRLIAAWETRPGAIVAPTHRGERRSPVLFDRRFFPELAALEGDAGGRLLLPRHPDAIHELEVDDPAQLADVDTPEDLRQLEAVIQRQ